jgi:hypothetical protein
MGNEDRQRLSIVFTEEANEMSLYERLCQVAKDQRRSLNWVTLEAVRLYIEAHEQEK